MRSMPSIAKPCEYCAIALLLCAAILSVFKWSEESKQATNGYSKRIEQLGLQLQEYEKLASEAESNGDLGRLEQFLSAKIFILWQLGRYDEAEKIARIALEFDLPPDKRLVLFGALAGILSDKQNYREAMIVVKQMIEIDQEHSYNDLLIRDKENYDLLSKLNTGAI